jgi:hypothetical protein
MSKQPLVEEMLRTILKADVLFQNFEIVKIEFSEISGSLMGHIQKISDTKIAEIIKDHGADKLNGWGTWDRVDVTLKVSSTYGMHPESFIRVSDQFRRFKGYELTYFTIEPDNQLRLNFESFTNVRVK